LLISLPATYYFGRRIARPLVALAASAHAIREGNLNVVLPDGGSDEVGVLARSFARMVSELKEKAELERFIAGMGFSPQDATHRRSPASALTEAGWTGSRRAGAEETPLGTGTVLGGRYVVEALLGRGGMASVWRARDRELDEEVALKVLRDDVVASHPRLVAQIKEEIKLGRRITHPNVLRTHDLGDLDGVRFISMELVPGPTLRSMLDRHGALSLPVGLQLGRQICRGLAAAHEAGVIHRDIKPQNIIVAQNGVAKIMDFGIALAQERHDAAGGDGQVAGTPDYMSPEQIQGKRVDARADVYALGVVLYEMFTGVRPFHAETAVQTLLRNLMEEPLPVRRLRPELPEALEALVLRTIVKNPEERTQTAVELRAALGQISS
jgi:serine/threonine-protein kinase